MACKQLRLQGDLKWDAIGRIRKVNQYTGNEGPLCWALDRNRFQNPLLRFYHLTPPLTDSWYQPLKKITSHSYTFKYGIRKNHLLIKLAENLRRLVMNGFDFIHCRFFSVRFKRWKLKRKTDEGGGNLILDTLWIEGLHSLLFDIPRWSIQELRKTASLRFIYALKCISY